MRPKPHPESLCCSTLPLALGHNGLFGLRHRIDVTVQFAGFSRRNQFRQYRCQLGGTGGYTEGAKMSILDIARGAYVRSPKALRDLVSPALA